MIIYKCDLCGNTLCTQDIITVRAVGAAVSKGFEICGRCFKEIEDRAETVKSENTKQEDNTDD